MRPAHWIRIVEDCGITDLEPVLAKYQANDARFERTCTVQQRLLKAKMRREAREAEVQKILNKKKR